MAKPKILLLDPDLKSRNILEISLKKAGFTVTSGESAADALDVVDTFDPNLILSEIALKDRDGFWLVEQLKNKHGRLKPMIFLTRQNRVEEKVKALDLGVEDYLVKPIYLREVLVRVRRLLEKQESQSSPAGARDDKPASNMFQGVLGDMSVVDILQTMEFGNKTAIIHVSTPKRDAQIFIQDGRPVHAVAGSLVGERAVYKMLQWTDGNFRIDFRKSLQVQATINTSTQGLIMEGVRRLDEIERLKEQLPPFSARLVIDSQIILEEHPDRFPAKIENIMAEFDSHKDVEAVVESLPYDDLESLEVISKLYFQGFLVEAPPQPEPAKAPEPKAERSSFAATGGVLDLDRLDLGSSASIENIKRKAKATQDDSQSGSQSSGRSTTRPAPVFDSLPGFSLAPPSDRVVKVSEKKKVGEAARKKDSESGSAAKFKEASSFRIGADDAAPVDMAPPVVLPKAPPVAPPAVVEPLRPAATAVPDQAVATAPPAATVVAEPEMAVIGNVISMQSARREPAVEKMPPVEVPAPVRSASRPSPAHLFEDTMLSEPSTTVAPPVSATAPLAPAGPRLPRVWLVAAVLLFGVLVGLAAWKLTTRGGRNAQELYQEALLQFESHDLEEADLLIGRALQLRPSHLPSRVLSADIEAARGNVQEALNLYNTVISTDPSLFDVRLRYAQLLYNQRQVPMAERALSECRRLEIDLSPMRDRSLYVATLVLETDVVLFLQRPKDARAPLARLEEIDPGNEHLPRLKMATERLRELQAEDEAAEGVVAPVITPTPPPVAEVVPVPAPKPTEKPAAKAAGKSNVAPPKTSPATADLKIEEAEALHRKGLDLYRKGHLKNSERAFLSALELAPDRDEVMIDLGRVYSELGQDRVALKYFLKAAQIDPKNPRVYVNLGSIYMLMGNRADAVKAYQTYVKLAPADDAEAREVRKILENLTQ